MSADSDAAADRRRPGRRWPRIVTVLAIIGVYLGSVVGYFWLDSSAEVLHPRDLSNVTDLGGPGTVVLIELTAINPVQKQA